MKRLFNKTFGLFLICLLTTQLVTAQTSSKEYKIQVALMLDTSGSMDGLIDQAKSQLWKIVNDLALAECKGVKPELQIALYEFGNDNNPVDNGYVRLLSGFTTDLDKISEDLFSLTTNGGSEYCGQVIDVSLNELKWTDSNDDLKMIFIAGNEGFDQGTINYKIACKEAIKKGVVVNTIFCGDAQSGINLHWKEGADLADGTYMNINQNEVVADIATPYDHTIDSLNTKLNGTYVSYGSLGKKMKERQVVQDKKAKKINKAGSIQRSLTKSSSVYKNSNWDMVDAMDEEGFEMDDIEEEELPDEMKGMSEKEKKEYVAKKKENREKISKEIKELAKKRQLFISAERKKIAEASGKEEEKTLDKAMIGAIRKQATKKNFSFKSN